MQLFRNIQSELIGEIEKSEKNLKIAVTWFTNHEIFDAILNKLDNPAFKVDLIVLNDRINNKKEGLDFQSFIEKKGSFYYSSNDNMVHHKFCIIDDEKVFTGSYNWTYYAENRNWENVVILTESKMVEGFVSEFAKVIANHKKVENVIKEQDIQAAITSNEYLNTDYTLQAQTEKNKGNELAVAKIYTELLKLNRKQPEILNARKEILQKFNNELFKVSPFEIGILFKNGYHLAIPAYTELPFEMDKTGKTTADNQKTIRVTIQKNDYIPRTILQFELPNLKPSPKGTEKIEHKLVLEKSGILTVYVKELNGFNRSKIEHVDLKNWL